MPSPKPSPSVTVPQQRDLTDSDDLTDAQKEFMEDLRVSLLQMKNGDVMPAREALREIELEENGSRPDA